MKRRIFIAGATGYVGSRLVTRLIGRGHRVVASSRSLAKLRDRTWADETNVELFECDIANTEQLERGLDGCDIAVYLVHSMYHGEKFAEIDRENARSFAVAAEGAKLDRIIYVSGLGDADDSELSDHLRSRREVEEVLRRANTPLTVLRAAVIIGSGSVSFEILRYLVNRLPIMITPRWVRTESQPVAIRDVLDALIACVESSSSSDKTFEIGSYDIVSYEAMMRLVAEVSDLPRRWIIPVPVLTPKLSSRWIHIVTPIDRRIAYALADGLRNRVVCSENDLPDLLGREPLSVRESIKLAIEKARTSQVESHWSDAGVIPGDPEWAGGKIMQDQRTAVTTASPSAVYRAVGQLGGDNGYYQSTWLWKIRGAMDRLIGGPGLSRGRRHPDIIRTGDALDFWRVMNADEPTELLLRAEMKTPGDAFLKFTIDQQHDQKTHITMTATFLPSGLSGLVYWYSVLPLHNVVFNDLLDGLCKTAERIDRENDYNRD